MSRTVDIETPELVVVSYTVAGVGSRVIAALIDYAICVAAMIVFFVIILRVGVRPSVAGGGASQSTAWVLAVLTLLQFAVLWLYYVLWEALADGQTPGKRAMRLRVVREGGLSLDFASSAVRNLVRIVDMQPGILYGAGLVSIIASTRSKRLGDYAAGTLVLKEDFIAAPSIPSTSPKRTSTTARTGSLAAGGTAAPPLATQLTESEYTVLEHFMRRRMQLDVSQRTGLSRELAHRFSSRLAATSSHGAPDASRMSADAFLAALYDTERSARAHGVAARGEKGAARERYAIVSANAARWSEMSTRIQAAQRRGLIALGAQGVQQFADDYRELTADLARLRTATRGAPSSDLFYLNRLVANAHSLLYRRRSLSPGRIVGYLFGDVPREIRRSWRPISLSAILLFGPMIVAGIAVVRTPSVVPMLVPPPMVDRADSGVARARAGTGYIDAPELMRPVFATSIVSNNVQVAFLAFALGITAGVMTAILLAFNGISIGAVFGLYQARGIGELLLAFVAPHGVLELTAIVIAGGAGFLLAAGMLFPGEHTRRVALVSHGMRAIRLVAGAALLLLVAGTLEGFVSPIPTWPLRDKLFVSATTAVGLVLYLLPRRHPREVRSPLAP